MGQIQKLVPTMSLNKVEKKQLIRVMFFLSLPLHLLSCKQRKVYMYQNKQVFTR